MNVAPRRSFVKRVYPTEDGDFQVVCERSDSDAVTTFGVSLGQLQRLATWQYHGGDIEELLPDMPAAERNLITRGRE